MTIIFQFRVLGQSLRQVRPSAGLALVRHLPLRVRHLERHGAQLHLDPLAPVPGRVQHRLRATVCHPLRGVPADQAEGEMRRAIGEETVALTIDNMRATKVKSFELLTL